MVKSPVKALKNQRRETGKNEAMKGVGERNDILMAKEGGGAERGTFQTNRVQEVLSSRGKEDGRQGKRIWVDVSQSNSERKKPGYGGYEVTSRPLR